MVEPKFATLTSQSAIFEKNQAFYEKQKTAFEASPWAKNLLTAVWPTGHVAPDTTHGATPLERDGAKMFVVEMPTFTVRKEQLLDLLDFTRNNSEFQYNFLLDLTALDFLKSPRAEDKTENDNKRFQMVYLFRSQVPERRSTKLRICVPVDEGEEVPSLTKVWVGANWPEREVFDLMGIRFTNHPNLRRIMMPDNYRGHPLRKDFPVKGIGEDYLIEDLLYKRRNVD
ncbi:MAG TPA: NADH-quinone oxidoreductase subunit C [Turneriella sp.]|nr:NADH-quinone oxidoreductase subunit C [Turneriella sp.]